VVFVKEIVPRRAIAWLARVIYQENYFALPMRHEVVPCSPTGLAVYEWFHARRWHRLALSFPAHRPCRRTSRRKRSSPSTIGATQGSATAARWSIGSIMNDGPCGARLPRPSICDVASFYGPAFAPSLHGQPSSAFVAKGSPVIVRRGVRL
jgi:hypothetical protein